ncbi:methyltransferase domain-containing protein [Corticibacter populi]|uniref:Methyltransferase domain-containing protein n=1 Tax=Corticibacter populi TaxID=1550736 RepID=A0A3M6R0E3_9BURK|nr:class I SAM-dependent methyltransferase [Corticibacter populi]RMX08727.1 methyltransferase domain-containing protein [Corticibacter populi]RZS36077.1 cyclopropane-fatty-acyl-phospholipid synthase [Corticibacter populi]
MLDQAIEAKLRKLPVSVAITLPGGRRIGPEPAQVSLRIHEQHTLAQLAIGQVGAVGEAIVQGQADLDGSMRDVMAAVTGLLPQVPVQSHSAFWTRGWRLILSAMRHTRSRDAEQVQFHYDVGDEFYALWLDPRRVYSCAYFRTPEASLGQAQEDKLDLICRKLMLRPGERFLDIGAGWGGLLLWAAEHYGVDATGITLSHNQHQYVNQLIEQKGLTGRVRMQLCDYRDLGTDQPFDKIASVGMFEHVGRANMGTYFGHLYQLLQPGGLLLNHGITAGGLNNTQLGAGLGDFIDKFIFPGGELIHISSAIRSLCDAGLEMLDTENLRPHYARTLWDWSDSLESQLDAAKAVLVTQSGNENRAETILRAYRLYLSGCALAFEQRWVALHQILASRPDNDMNSGSMRGAQTVYPFQRDYMYAR